MARSADDPRLCFKALYHDEMSGLTREFQLRFFFGDRSVELTDLNTRKVFLKRTEAQNLEKPDFVIGKTVVVFGRLLHLVEYMDVVTQQLCEGAGRSGGGGGGGLVSSSSPSSSPTATVGVALSSSTSSSFPPTGGPQQHYPNKECGSCYVFVERSRFFSTIGKVLSVLDVELGFTITGITAGTLPAAAAHAAAQSITKGEQPYPLSPADAASIASLAGKMLCCFRLSRAGCSSALPEIYKRLLPPSSSSSLSLSSSSGLFAVAVPTADTVVEDCYAAISSRTASKCVSGISAVGSVVIIKPHILLRKAAGDVLQVLLDQSGAELVGLSLINMSSRDATSMLAPYRGVLPDLHNTVAQLSSGSAIAVHLCSKRTAAALAAEDLYRDGQGGVAKGGCEAGTTTATTPLVLPAIRQQQQQQGGGGGGGRGGAAAAAQALEAADDSDVFHAVRALCGPYDPTIAKALRSSTIRARYGVDRSLNAVHCCDIEEDVSGVCSFVFAFLAVRKVLKPSSECS